MSTETMRWLDRWLGGALFFLLALPASCRSTCALALGRRFIGLSPVPLILLGPDSGDLLPQRRWPQERFVDIAQRVQTGDPLLCPGFVSSGSRNLP